MSHPAPRVVIDGQDISGLARAVRPVLAGLSLDFGVDSDSDMQTPETAFLEVLIREPVNLAFLQLGHMVSIYHQSTGTESSFTYFVGRIQRMEVHPEEAEDGSIRVSINATCLLADLANETLYDINAAAVPATTRLNSYRYWLDDSWELGNFGARWPDREHGELHYEEKSLLEMLDQSLRGQLMIRRNASFYTPNQPVGESVTKRLVLMEDSSQDQAADKLKRRDDGTWTSAPGYPEGKGTLLMELPASNVLSDAGWAKEADDVITEVAVGVIRPTTYNAEKKAWPDSETFAKVSRKYIDTQAMRRRYGVRTLDVETDLPNTADTAVLAPIFNHWISPASRWRARSITIRDSDLLSITALGYLLAPTSRFSILLNVTGLMDNRPDYEVSDIRGLVIGGNAVWDGDSWEISLNLGHRPDNPSDGDYWSIERMQVNGTYSYATCASVGDELSCYDFLRIGKP